jgi:RTX calcium-binding nonapeptide repeat (4 copies)
MAISTNGTVLARVAGALYNTQMSNATYEEVKTLDPSSLANALFARDFSSATDATVATTLVTNLGLTAVEGLDNWVAAQLTAAGSAKGAKVVELLNGFAQMSADATYGAAATAFNTKVDAALALSQTAGNAGGTFAAAGVAPVSGGTFTLTTGNDVADTNSALRGSLVSDFKFTSGNETAQGTVGTLTSGDVLVDGSTTDADTLSVTLKVASGAFTAQNIENINVNFMAGTNPALNMDNVLGTTKISTSGTAAGIVNGFAADSVQPTIEMNGYTQQLTISPTTLAGTTALGTAETVNLAVTGVTYGSTAATRSIALIDGTANGSLEVLNVASNGTAANAFKLDVAASDSIARINISGDAALTMRADAAEITGVTVTSTATTTATLAIDMNSTSGATPVNAANYSGIALAAYDSTAGSDTAGMSSLKDGASITLMSDFDASEFTVQGTSYAVQANALSFTLDHSTANTDLDVANITVENVKALTFTSNGNAASESTTAQNNIGTLDGDATTITILGDTSFTAALDIDATETATTTTARTVTVNASGMTGNAFVVLTAATDSKVTYNMTGTANDDQLSTNATGGSLTGGAGDDVLTGGNGVNVISGGEGDDTIVVSYGLDTLTGGDGDDVYDINTIEVKATTQVTTSADIDGSATIASGDQIVAVVNGQTYTVTSGSATIATELTAFLTAHKAAIQSTHDVTVTAGTGTLIFTGLNDGTAFTAEVFFNDGGTVSEVTMTTTTGAAAKDITSTITDFAAGDVLDLAGITHDVSGTDTAIVRGGAGYYEGTAAGLTATSEYDFIVLTTAYADYDAAEAAIAAVLDLDTFDGSTDDTFFVFLNSTTGKAEMYFDLDVDSDNNVAAIDKVMTFENITSLTGLATAFSADSYIIS